MGIYTNVKIRFIKIEVLSKISEKERVWKILYNKDVII